MRQTARIRRDSLPATIVRHLEQQGLGWGSPAHPGTFWIRTPRTKGR